MHESLNLESLQPQIGNYLQALILATLKGIDAGGTEQIMRKLDKLTDIVERGDRAAMERIDAATNEIGAQLEEIAAQMPDDDTARRLRAHIGRLNAIGKPAAPVTP